MIDLHHRLKILLFMVPYVVRHRGVPLSELAERLGIGENDLLKELDFLLMVGQPPFLPNDMLDIYEEDGKVFVDLHQSFDRPPTFSVFEALALACAAQVFTTREVGDAAIAIKVAVDKVVSALPSKTQKLFKDLSAQYLLLPGGSVAESLELLRRAIDERREVDIQHYSANRGEYADRTVQPYDLFHHRGIWYLVAFCHRRNEVRVFRMSRIREAILTDRIFDRPSDFNSLEWFQKQMTIPSQGTREVVIRFSPKVSRLVQERWDKKYLSFEADGCVRAKLHDCSDEYVLSYTASFGGEAAIESPKELADKLKTQAKKIIETYHNVGKD